MKAEKLKYIATNKLEQLRPTLKYLYEILEDEARDENFSYTFYSELNPWFGSRFKSFDKYQEVLNSLLDDETFIIIQQELINNGFVVHKEDSGIRILTRTEEVGPFWNPRFETISENLPRVQKIRISWE